MRISDWSSDVCSSDLMRMIGICMERQHIGVIVLEQDPGERLGGVLQRLGIGRTAGMMVVEIIAGWLTGSMALLADGMHMATHAGALGAAALAYRFARRHAAPSKIGRAHV